MKYPSRMDELSIVETHACAWARQIEDREAAASGHPLSVARKSVARRLGVSPGTLENLRRGRAKTIGARMFERLRAAIIRDLQAELNRCAHEIDLARQAGLDPRCAEMDALKAATDKAKTLIEGTLIGDAS